ncbi:hypothetical protein LSH36_380g06010 [Paralvinella palmiformis]|uniref:TIR domain-containing protein n=1 Tax=Paralvinella palmiformis TaxID=53620 RepID=A0AAD9N0Y7_9ANNE|nr:hypothetical protein LSH36_380g06010 [Paralvinella palmiformis]
MSDIFTPPILPTGKIYHAMFNFQSEDRRWVRKIFSKLEADPYKLKCCIADRDFHAGKEVITNIEECMSQSMNIVLIITPSFLESHYCNYETSMAHEMMHTEGAKIIPVLRRGGEIPSSLRFINYIDARDDVDDTEVVDKLSRAVAEGLPQKSGSYSIGSRETIMKGDGILITGHNDGWRNPTYRAMSCRCYTYGNSDYLSLLFWINGCFLPLYLLVPGPFHVMLNRCKIKTEIKLLAWKSTVIMKKLNLLVLLCAIDNKPSIRIVHYDFDKCTNCIADSLKNELEKYMTTQNLDTKDIQELAKKIVERELLSYCYVFVNDRPIASYPRHPVRRDLVCLCQFVNTDHIRRYIHSPPGHDSLCDEMFKCWKKRTDDTLILVNNVT